MSAMTVLVQRPVAETVGELLAAEQLAEAEELLTVSDELAEAQADHARRVAALTNRAWCRYQAGILSQAVSDAQLALGLIELAARRALWAPLAAGALISALIEQDQLEEAKRAAAGALERPGGAAFRSAFDLARCRLLLATGEFELAGQIALEVGTRRAFCEVPGIARWRPLATEALARAGATDQARALAEQELRDADGHGRIGVALAARALTVPGLQRLDDLQAAISQLARSPFKLDHARALIECGAALRRARHRAESRDPLRRGIDLATRCGATRLAAYGSTELRASGARPRSLLLTGVDALTPSELRVARLAAEGRSNPNIGATLFITRKTVEAHMQSVFAKLDIGSRTQLAGALAAVPS
jgi:DNA-binding CsgD family transcriptional regulator